MARYCGRTWCLPRMWLVQVMERVALHKVTQVVLGDSTTASQWRLFLTHLLPSLPLAVVDEHGSHTGGQASVLANSSPTRDGAAYCPRVCWCPYSRWMTSQRWCWRADICNWRNREDSHWLGPCRF